MTAYDLIVERSNWAREILTLTVDNAAIEYWAGYPVKCTRDKDGIVLCIDLGSLRSDPSVPPLVHYRVTPENVLEAFSGPLRDRQDLWSAFKDLSLDCIGSFECDIIIQHVVNGGMIYE